MTLPIGALQGDPRHDGNLRHLEETLGNVLVHADGGAEYAGADKRQASQVEQTLNRAVFAEGAVHHGKDDVEALSAAAAVQLDERGVGGIGGPPYSLAALQSFTPALLRPTPAPPITLLLDASTPGLLRLGHLAPQG